MSMSEEPEPLKKLKTDPEDEQRPGNHRLLHRSSIPLRRLDLPAIVPFRQEDLVWPRDGNKPAVGFFKPDRLALDDGSRQRW